MNLDCTRGRMAATLAAATALLGTGCAASAPPAARAAGDSLPVEQFCLEAQRVVVGTDHPFLIQLHEDTEAFVRSKAEIDPPRVHQYIWYEDAAGTRPAMISCKLKSADHLNLVFGEGTAGPSGSCQDMNQVTVERVLATRGGNAPAIVLDRAETVSNSEQPGMTGPEWLLPYALTSRDGSGALVIHAKGFGVEFLDPRFLDAPPPFRGVQYCHFIAPSYLARLLDGQASPGQVFGVDVTDRPDPAR
jgi:hypothetical protein